MKIKRYKDDNKKSYKKKIIVLFVMVFILMFISFILAAFQKNTKTTELTYNNLTNIKEVIEYHKSTYISENESKEENFYLEVYLKFKVPPYVNDKSNEKYYNDLLEDCAKVLRYRNFIMNDSENDIIVKVICSNQKISSIIINDIEDYFIYMDSQISLQKYTEIPITDFNIEAQVLKDCINNNWNSNTYIGQRDSIFEEYYIYFDEGIKTKNISNQIYNIVFDKNYKGNVVNDLFPGIDLKSVEAKLGKPTFNDEDTDVIGYKGENIYVFFTEDEISIYRRDETDTDDFFELADKFISDEMDLLEFMNELTYIWPDYNKYEYDDKSVYISYPLKGVEIKVNKDDTNGIMVYNNIRSNLNKVKEYFKNTNFVARLQLDLVYEAEKTRYAHNMQWTEKCNEYSDSLSDEKRKVIGESLNYNIYPEKDNNGSIYSIKFISKFGTKPNRELNDGVTSFLWLTSDYFLYSKSQKGIYLYDLTTGKTERLKQGNGEYELKEYKDGILKYDDMEEIINF